MPAELDAAYARTAANLEENAAVEVERTGERDRLVLSPLDKLEEPESLLRLREAVDALMPRVDLPEVLRLRRPAHPVAQRRIGPASHLLHDSLLGMRAVNVLRCYQFVTLPSPHFRSV